MPRTSKYGTAPKELAKAIGLKEKHVEETVTQFLQLDGWRAFKMEAQSDRSLVARFMAKVYAHDLLKPLAQIIHYTLKNVMRGSGVGEKNMPDHLYIRYLNKARIECPTIADTMLTVVLKAPAAEVLWCEFKKPGEKPRPDQIAWHETERERGALVVVVDDIDHFIKTWYPASGLQRHTPRQFAKFVNDYDPKAK